HATDVCAADPAVRALDRPQRASRALLPCQSGDVRVGARMHVSPAFDRRLAELSPDSDRVWLAGLSTGLTLTVVAAFAPLPANGGTMCAYLGLLIHGALYLRAGETLRDRGGGVVAALFRLGIVAGLFELIVDWWLVHGVANGRLDYLGAKDVVLLASPL